MGARSCSSCQQGRHRAQRHLDAIGESERRGAPGERIEASSVAPQVRREPHHGIRGERRRDGYDQGHAAASNTARFGPPLAQRPQWLEKP